MDLIQESYQRLFSQKEFKYQTKIEYNRRLSNFNANISLHRNIITIKMNLLWKNIDDEIKIGLIQHLLCKILKSKTTTTNIEIYNNFTKNIPLLTPKTKIDPLLETSFCRVNQQLLGGSLEMPNLQWGRDSRRKLACYNYNNGTLTVSNIFKDARTEILDFLMYHEMLHKHFQFTNNNGRHSYHNTNFRYAEKMYPNHKLIEKEINSIIRKSRRIIKKEITPKLWSFFH